MTRARRRIDHVVVAVHHLDSAGAFYERLGFTVGVRNRHPWGTENRLIQFGSSFIELVTVGREAGAIPRHEEGRFSFGGFVRSYLRDREGQSVGGKLEFRSLRIEMVSAFPRKRRSAF